MEAKTSAPELMSELSDDTWEKCVGTIMTMSDIHKKAAYAVELLSKHSTSRSVPCPVSGSLPCPLPCPKEQVAANKN